MNLKFCERFVLAAGFKEESKRKVRDFFERLEEQPLIGMALAVELGDTAMKETPSVEALSTANLTGTLMGIALAQFSETEGADEFLVQLAAASALRKAGIKEMEKDS